MPILTGAKHPEEFAKVFSSATAHLGNNPSDELRNCICTSLHVLGVRSVAHLPDLVTISIANVQENCAVLSAVISTVPQFTSAYISDIIVAMSRVSYSGDPRSIFLIINNSFTAY